MFGWFGKVSFVPYSKVSAFAAELKGGRLMGTRCTACGHTTFPPRADCGECGSDAFAFSEYSGRGQLYTFTRIVAPPAGFEDAAPYTIGVVDLEEGGRLLAWIGETLAGEPPLIGMPVQVVPRLFEELEEIRVHYTIERPGTTWQKAPA